MVWTSLGLAAVVNFDHFAYKEKLFRDRSRSLEASSIAVEDSLFFEFPPHIP